MYDERTRFEDHHPHKEELFSMRGNNWSYNPIGCNNKDLSQFLLFESIINGSPHVWFWGPPLQLGGYIYFIFMEINKID